MTDLPTWYVAAIKEIGTRELPENRGPNIRRYMKLARCGAEGEPWCAVFANAMIETAGITGTGSALARSFEKHPSFVKLAGPALGAIVTFWRQSKASGLGHVGFYAGEKMGRIYTLGGNEGDMVQVEPFGESAHFGRSGFYWPKSVALPKVGAVPPQLPVGTAATGKVV
jgi:uncharacterized protein (TIGR02594 family)